MADAEAPPPTITMSEATPPQNNSTTTTTTKTTTSNQASTTVHGTTIAINVSYLLPQGILKIVEILFCIIVFSLVAESRGWLLGLSFWTQDAGYWHGPTFALAVGIIFFLTTLILLILFLFNLVAKAGGSKIWFTVDTVLNGLAVLLFLLGFILLCIYCSFDYKRRVGFSNVRVKGTISRLVAAAVFSLINAILYVVSIVFAVKAGQAPMISVKA